MPSKKIFIGDDFNGHVESDAGGFDKVHGRYGIGQLNDGGVRLMIWAVGKRMKLMNIFGKTRWNGNVIVVKTGLNSRQVC